MSFVALPTPAALSAVSSVSFPSASDTVLVASYDNSVRLYNYKKQRLALGLTSPAPVLAVAHSSYGTTYAGLLDGTIRCVDYENTCFSRPAIAGPASGGDSAAPCVPGVSSGVNCIRPLDSTSFVATSYDGNIVLFDPRTPRLAHQQKTPGKIFAMDTCPNLVTLGKSQSAVEIYDVRNIVSPVSVRATGLRFQVTNLRNFPSGDGYALSSVDGRVSVEYYDESAESQAQKYAFKCHRSRDPNAGEDSVFPVTGLDFHPLHGTLLTAGGDGNVCVWNWAKRKRMKLFTHGETPGAISQMALSADGTHMAVSVGDDAFSRAKSEESGVLPGGRVLIRQLSESDVKPKAQ